MGFVAHDLGVDLGTSNTLVYVKHKGIMISEPTIVVVDAGNERKVRAVGDDAKIMLGRTTEGVMAVRPMREGVITDFDMTEIMIQYFMRKAIGSSYLVKPRLFLSYPCSISAIERRAVGEAAKYAGSRKVLLVEKPFAAALGSGLPVFDPNGCMVVDIGGGTTDAAVISLGGVVISHSVRVGGVKMDEAIIDFIKREFNILIGDRTAEEVKCAIVQVAGEGEETLAVKGRCLNTGLPREVTLSGKETETAFAPVAQTIVSAVQDVLERTPPELAADVAVSGILLTGGGSLLRGMDALLAQETGMATHLAEDPIRAVALGLEATLPHLAKRQEGVLNLARRRQVEV